MLFFDIETQANKEAIKFMPKPEAPSNYKDEAKIAAYIEAKQQEQIERAALDADYGKIIALGYKVDDQPVEAALVTSVGLREIDVLHLFWGLLAEQRGECCGYNIIGFDLPYILRRSFALGVKPKVLPNLRKYQTYPVCDLMGILYNWGQAKGLKLVAARYGLDNPLPDLDGSQVNAMDAETLERYVKNDVNLVYQLYQKMRGVYL